MLTKPNFKKVYFIFPIILGGAVFLYFHNIFSDDIPEYANTITSSFLGSLITMLVTYALLGQQLKSELQNKKDVKLYKERLDKFQRFIPVYMYILEQKKVSRSSLVELKKLCMSYMLISDTFVPATIMSYIEQLMVIGKHNPEDLTESDWDKFINWYANYFNEDKGSVDHECFITVEEIITYMRMTLDEEEANNAGMYINMEYMQKTTDIYLLD